jgi:hypothetical protein
VADKLAREGSAAILCGSKPAWPLSGSIAELMTTKWADNAHLNYWESVSNCQQPKLWLVRPNLNVSIETSYCHFAKLGETEWVSQTTLSV